MVSTVAFQNWAKSFSPTTSLSSYLGRTHFSLFSLKDNKWYAAQDEAAVNPVELLKKKTVNWYIKTSLKAPWSNTHPENKRSILTRGANYSSRSLTRYHIDDINKTDTHIELAGSLYKSKHWVEVTSYLVDCDIILPLYLIYILLKAFFYRCVHCEYRNKYMQSLCRHFVERGYGVTFAVWEFSLI